jgi:hypothetical protein
LGSLIAKVSIKRIREIHAKVHESCDGGFDDGRDRYRDHRLRRREQREVRDPDQDANGYKHGDQDVNRQTDGKQSTIRTG